MCVFVRLYACVSVCVYLCVRVRVRVPVCMRVYVRVCVGISLCAHMHVCMIDRVYRDRATWAAAPAKFEAGTGPIAQAIALGAAIDYVSAIGFDAMHAHEQELVAYARQYSPFVR